MVEINNLQEKLGIHSFIENFAIEEIKDNEKIKKLNLITISFKFNIEKFLFSIKSIINISDIDKKEAVFLIYLPKSKINNLLFINSIIELLSNKLIINNFNFNKMIFLDNNNWKEIDQLKESIDYIKNTIVFTRLDLEENINNLKNWKFNLKWALIKLFSSKEILIETSKSNLEFQWRQVFLPNLIYNSIQFEDIINYLESENFIKIKHLINNDNNFSYKINTNLDAIDKFLSEIKINSNKVFIGLTFSSKFEDVRKIIKLVLFEVGYESIILDEIEHNGLIDEILIEKMELCKFAIFDISDRNPNVYFEVGYIKSMNKDTILICKRRKKVGFDLAHINIIFYSNIDELRQKLERRIRVTNPPK